MTFGVFQVFEDDAAKDVYDRFHASMLEYAKVVDGRNEALEDRQYIFNDFNPRYCKCSVSS